MCESEFLVLFPHVYHGILVTYCFSVSRRMLIRPLLVFGAFSTTIHAVEVELVGQGSKVILDSGESSELHLTTDLLGGILNGADPSWSYLGSKMDQGVTTAARKNYELKSVTREDIFNYPTYEFNVGTHKGLSRPMRIVLATFTFEGPFIQASVKFTGFSRLQWRSDAYSTPYEPGGAAGS